MKEFFKMMFASLLGFFISLFLIFLLFIGIIASIASFASKEPVVLDKNSLLIVKLNEPLQERASNNPMEKLDFRTFKSKEVTGLDEVLKNINKAAKDPNIKGIFLDLSVIPSGLSMIEEVRNALIEFKKTKKFIISYSENYTQGTYYLASVADKVYLNPQGYFVFKGLVANLMFLKGALAKLDIEMQVLRHGKYKAAVEPFVNDKMSDENKKQTIGYITALWNVILKDISASRNISTEELNKIADDYKIRTAEDALKYKFVDKLTYRDEVLAELVSFTKVKEIKD